MVEKADGKNMSRRHTQKPAGPAQRAWNECRTPQPIGRERLIEMNKLKKKAIAEDRERMLDVMAGIRSV